MMCMTDLSNTEQVKELREVIKQCVKCSFIATLKQFLRKPDGTFNSVDLTTVSCEEVNVEMNVDNDKIYISVSSKEKIQLMQIKNMWNTKIKRGTQRFMQGTNEYDRLNDYVMVIDFIKEEFENNLIYHLSVPDLMWLHFDDGRDDCMIFYLNIKDMFFGIEEVTLQEIEYEAEVLEKESGYGYIDPDEEYDYNDKDEVENEDYIGYNNPFNA